MKRPRKPLKPKQMAGQRHAGRDEGAKPMPESAVLEAAVASTGTAVPQAAAFDPEAAVFYGAFVAAAYSMYDAGPENLTPPESPDFPQGYRLVAWIHMNDFIIESTGPVFYGFIAQSAANTSRFIVAIRGTADGTEWWDDLNAIVKTPFKVPGCGSVGSGFARIYDTLEVVERPSGLAAAAAARPQSLKPVGGFARQVSDLVARHAPASAVAAGLAPSSSVEVAGHSLGSALATLYVLENARTDGIRNPSLCTFASPRVGDSTFAGVFDALQLISWRIVNAPDLVPMLPPEWLGFAHVNVEKRYDSRGKVRSSPTCWHSLATYLSLIDPTRLPAMGCRLGLAAAAALPGRAATGVASAIAAAPPHPGPAMTKITVDLRQMTLTVETSDDRRS